MVQLGGWVMAHGLQTHPQYVVTYDKGIPVRAQLKAGLNSSVPRR